MGKVYGFNKTFDAGSPDPDVRKPSAQLVNPDSEVQQPEEEEKGEEGRETEEIISSYR